MTDFRFGARTGAELDMLWVKGSRRIGFEAKRTSAPQVTKSLRSAISVLGLRHSYVIHAGTETFPLARDITALAASRIVTDL